MNRYISATFGAIASIILSCYGACPSPDFFDAGNLCTTNIVMQENFTATTNIINPGRIIITSVGPSWMAFEQRGQFPVIPYKSGIIGFAGLHTNLEVSPGFSVRGDLFVSGNIFGSSNIIGATNVWTQTNTVAYTNVFYLTNSQISTIDMSLPYGLIGPTATPLDFVAMANTVDTLAQTAVVLVTNATSPHVTVALTSSMSGLHTQGTMYVTNVTACSFFRYGNEFTNLIALPLW